MKLLRFRLEQLRQFRQPLAVDGLAPGLNLFVGPNESGKSTIVRALRAAFFERHRSSSVEDLQPWGDSAAAPTIALEFDWAGERWALTKSFLRQKRCDLRIGNLVLSGEEAEQRLADLLGFELAGRGASRPEHWGVPGLLWIEQGSAQDIRQPVHNAGKHLQAVLASSLGEMASSEGDALISRVEAERGRLLTAQGRPRGALQEALEQHASLHSEAASLAARVDQYRQQVDRLAQLRAALQQDESEQLWQRYRADAAAAQAKLNEIAAWERSQRHDQEALQTNAASIATSQELLQRFAAQLDERGQRQQALTAAKNACQARQAEAGQRQAALEQARQQFTAARTSLQAARSAEQQASWQRELQQLTLDLADGEQRLARVRALATELATGRTELQQLALEPALLKQLRQLEQHLAQLELNQQTLATRLQFRLADGEVLQLDGEVLSGQGERLLLAAARLELAEGSTLDILPGGADTATLLREATLARDARAALLTRLGVDSLAAAEARAEAARTAAEVLRRNEAVLQSLAPQGLAELQGRQQQRQARQLEVQQQLASLAADTPPATDSPPSIRQAEQQLAAAEAALQAAEQADNGWRSALLLAQQTVTAAEHECAVLDAALQAPDRQQQEQAAQAQLLERRARAAHLQQQLDQRAARIAAANPALLQQDIERLTRSADAAESSTHARRLELERLQASLAALDADGLEERAAEVAAAVQRAARREEELQHRAAALNLLRELLQTQRQALTRQLQAPLQRHLQHYLALLFPGASLEVDEALVPELLLRPGQQQLGEYSQIDGLSFGAREQMGLISRLAYADLLHEAGRPTLLMLDDALVHSDVERLAAMKRVLFDAAQRHQILLFSCHPQHWRDLGVDARELATLRSDGLAY